MSGYFGRTSHVGVLLFSSCVSFWPYLRLSSPPDMTTYYFRTLEEALKKAKAAVKKAEPGCYMGGIVLRSGRKGFAVYKDGKAIEQYSAIGRNT